MNSVCPLWRVRGQMRIAPKLLRTVRRPTSAYRMAYVSDAFCVQRPKEAGLACFLLGEPPLPSWE